MEVLALLLKHKLIILFYILVILFLYFNRKKLAVQAKIIVLYRTLFGIRRIEIVGEKYKEWIKLFGYVGIGVGFIGAVVVIVLLIVNLVQLFALPEKPSEISLVLPGVNVPGLGVLPFWHWLIAIFVIAVVHEFAHGIVAKAHGLKVNWTGIVLIGPIIGAFVEPDEKKLQASEDVIQYSVYAAGAFANVLLGILAAVVILYVLIPANSALTEPTGFSFGNYYNGSYPAEIAGLMPNAVITEVNGVEINNYFDFFEFMQRTKPNEKLDIVADGKAISLVTVEHPQIKGQGFIGITAPKNEVKLRNEANKTLYAVVKVLKEFFLWLSGLSLGIGLINLLPVPIVDGGRMFQTAFRRIFGDKKGGKVFARVSLFLLLVLVLNLIIPFSRWLAEKII